MTRWRRAPGCGASSGSVATGAAGDFPAASPADPLVDLVYALKAGYRQNGSFVMSRRTQGAVRKLKDENGQYLWAPPTAPGTPPSLLGFPVHEAEEMPDIGAGSLSVAFGDFRRGYLVVDRAGVRRAARSLFRQALCAVLHHQARRRRRAGLRRHQAAEVRGVAARAAHFLKKPPQRRSGPKERYIRGGIRGVRNPSLCPAIAGRSRLYVSPFIRNKRLRWKYPRTIVRREKQGHRGDHSKSTCLPCVFSRRHFRCCWQLTLASLKGMTQSPTHRSVSGSNPAPSNAPHAEGPA